MPRSALIALAALAALAAPGTSLARDVPIHRRMPPWAYVDLYSGARPVLVPAGLAFARIGHGRWHRRVAPWTRGCHVLSRRSQGIGRHLVGLWAVYRCD